MRYVANRVKNSILVGELQCLKLNKKQKTDQSRAELIANDPLCVKFVTLGVFQVVVVDVVVDVGAS